MFDHSKQLKRRRTLRYVLFALAASVVLAAAIGGGMMIGQKVTKESISSEFLAQEAGSRVVTAVGKLIELPKDEEPTLARVQDKSKLKEQDFFKNAQNQDYLLIYTKAKLAIIYRESTNKLINVGPVTAGDQAGQTAGDSTVEPKP